MHSDEPRDRVLQRADVSELDLRRVRKDAQESDVRFKDLLCGDMPRA